MSERIEIRTLTDGGQPPAETAHAVAAFIDGGDHLELAQYDFNLGAETAQIVGDAIRRADARGVADPIRLQHRPREPHPGTAAARARRDTDLVATGRLEGDRRHP